jgi:hypothetical protein
MTDAATAPRAFPLPGASSPPRPSDAEEPRRAGGPAIGHGGAGRGIGPCRSLGRRDQA